MSTDPIVAVCAVVAGVVIVVIPIVFLFAKMRDRSISREIKEWIKMITPDQTLKKVVDELEQCYCRIRSLEARSSEMSATKAEYSDLADLGKRIMNVEATILVHEEKMEAANIMKRRKLDLEND